LVEERGIKEGQDDHFVQDFDVIFVSADLTPLFENGVIGLLFLNQIALFRS